MEALPELNLSLLQQAVSSAVALRSISTLMPAGGPGDKVFPPTYAKDDRAENKYATETRHIDGREVKSVILDSVASQANRMEEALLEGWRRKELLFPVVQVDFSKEEGLADLEQITTLQAPHRIADAIFRDSLLDKTLFRYTPIGQAFTDARPLSATGMYRYCPTALLFGVWDSTGPKGGLGSKFQRCLVSEIVGLDMVTGVKTQSRIDPLGVEKRAADILQHKNPQEGWTLSSDEAAREKGKPALYARKGEGKGTPSAINHGNVAPSLDSKGGGVTLRVAQQTTVLSFSGLRRLRFVQDCSGKPIPAASRDAAEGAARTALAALALAAVVYQREVGYDLRSRALLVPQGRLVLQVLDTDGGATSYRLDRAGAARLLTEAVAAAAKLNLGWDAAPITLQPAPKLADLVRRSRQLRQIGEGEEGVSEDKS